MDNSKKLGVDMDLSWEFPYGSQRMPVLAKNIVATSQPLAAQAGLKMLHNGGNAVDAALATAITLTVVEPTSNGIGGDAFALVWSKGKLCGLNGSGKSPKAWTYKRFSMRKDMPLLGWDAVTVPGAVDAWVKLSDRFGSLPFAELFAPAIEYASNGFIVSPVTAARWFDIEKTYLDFPEFGRTFLPGGKAPRAGDLFCCPDQAMSLTAIAESRGESFYQGDLYFLPTYGAMPSAGRPLNDSAIGEVVSMAMADFDKDNLPDVLVGTRTTSSLGKLLIYFYRQ